MVALGPIDPDQQHRQLPPRSRRLDSAWRRLRQPNGAVLNLGTSSHQPSASSPSRRGHGLDERAQAAPTRSVWCSPAGWPHSNPPLSQAHCIAISSFLLAATPTAGTARGATSGCGGSSLTPGRAGWSRGHGSGVPPSAQRHPPGEGAAAPAGSSSTFQHAPDDLAALGRMLYPPGAGQLADHQ